MLGRDIGGFEAAAERSAFRNVLAALIEQHVLHQSETPDLVLGFERRIVGDVVAHPRETVEGMHMRPEIGANECRADREVLVPRMLARRRRDIDGGRGHASPSARLEEDLGAACIRPFHCPPRPDQ